MNRLLFIDYETVYDSKSKYDLRSMDTVSYVRDPRFKAFGLGLAFDSNNAQWITAAKCKSILAQLDWANITVVGHNNKFDAFILKDRYGIIAGQYIDTLAMSRAVLGKTIKSHSLASLATHFGFEAKGHLDTNGKATLSVEEENALAAYCIHDIELCRAVFMKLAPQFPKGEYPALDQTIRMFVDPKLQLNVPILEQSATEEALRRANIFKDIGIDKSEFASNVKFPALLESRGFEVPTKDSPRKKDDARQPVKIPALALGDTEFLEMLEGENEELRTLCEARVAAKSTLLETRSIKLASLGRTGLWPFDVEYSGADQTHRFSGGSGAGGNPQNFTRGSALRSAVEAQESSELVVGDFANIELRIQAYLSKDPGLVTSIETGKDIYCDFASAFYSRTITKDDKQERRFGKTAILGLGYGMGWKKFIKTVRVQTGETIDEDTSRRAVDLYRTKYAQIPAIWEKLDRLIQGISDGSIKSVYGLPVTFRKGEIVLPSGLAIKFPNLRQEAQETGMHHMEWVYDVWVKGHIEKRKLYGGKVLENICQGLAGELTKTAMVAIGANVVGQIHDELIVTCKKGLGGPTAAKLKRLMSVSPDWLPNMKLEAEVHVGKNWLEAK